MSEDAHHQDPSSKWLTFFFVCFGMTVFAIGVFALFTYHVDAPEGAAEAGHHGMSLPQDVPHARPSLTV